MPSLVGSPMPRIVSTLLSVCCAVTASQPAIAVPVAAGANNLPLTGLDVQLPTDARAGFSWNLSASWMLDAAGSYDGHDVIDETVRGRLVGRTHVHVDSTSDVDCAARARGAPMNQAWEASERLWGHEVTLRGGVHAAAGDSNGRPTVLLCNTRDGVTLRIQRFFLDQPAGMTRDAMLAAVKSASLFEAILEASAKNRASSSVAPLRRPDVRSRGGVPAARAVELSPAGIKVSLAQDGTIWVANGERLTRVAPALPAVTLEVLYFPNVTCPTVFSSIDLPRRPNSVPRDLPAGWQPGPTVLNLERPALTLCRELGTDPVLVGGNALSFVGDALLVGISSSPFSESVLSLQSTLDAVASAAAARAAARPPMTLQELAGTVLVSGAAPFERHCGVLASLYHGSLKCPPGDANAFAAAAAKHAAAQIQGRPDQQALIHTAIFFRQPITLMPTAEVTLHLLDVTGPKPARVAASRWRFDSRGFGDDHTATVGTTAVALLTKLSIDAGALASSGATNLQIVVEQKGVRVAEGAFELKRPPAGAALPAEQYPPHHLVTTAELSRRRTLVGNFFGAAGAAVQRTAGRCSEMALAIRAVADQHRDVRRWFQAVVQDKWQPGKEPPWHLEQGRVGSTSLGAVVRSVLQPSANQLVAATGGCRADAAVGDALAQIDMQLNWR